MFPLLCWGLASAGFLLFQHQIGGYGPNTAANIAKCIGDGAPVALVALLLPWRCRWITLTLMWILSIFFIANVCYFRFWDNLLPPVALTMTGNLNSTLIDSGAGLVSPLDLLYILIPAAVTVAALLPTLRPSKSLSPIWKAAGAIATLLAMAVAGALFLHSANSYRRSENLPILSAGDYIRDVNATVFNASNLYRRYGFTLYMAVSLRELSSILRFDRHLDPGERLRIQNFIYRHADVRKHLHGDSVGLVPTRIDSVFAANRNRNLIVIIVESLNSEAIRMRVNGHEVMPVLSGLAVAEGSVAALNVVPQIKDGSSGDGHLMTNTGLLPLRSGSASMLAGNDHIFPSLPHILRRKATAVFADNGETWNQNGFFRNLGFDPIINSATPGRHRATGADGIMFEQALGALENLQPPFLLEAVSISMHVPFREEGVSQPSWITSAGLPDNVAAYLSACNYFDTQLGLFIETLKRKGIFDDTVTVILSDHTQKNALIKDSGHSPGPGSRMAFIAVNAGITERIERTVGQIDIFPTILDIMGVDTDSSGYRGLGESVFNPSLDSAVASDGSVDGDASSPLIPRQREAWEISDLILRGDYFRKNTIR